MPDQLRTLPLTDAAPGMRLGRPICDSRGAVLLPEGLVLDVQHLAALQRRGIGQVAIAEEAPPMSDAERAAQAARIDHLFRRIGDDPLNRALHAAIREYRLGRQA